VRFADRRFDESLAHSHAEANSSSRCGSRGRTHRHVAAAIDGSTTRVGDRRGTAPVSLTSMTVIAKDTTACMANPTLSGRGRKSQMTAAAAKMSKWRYRATATIRLVHGHEGWHALLGESYEHSTEASPSRPTADARKSQRVTTPPVREG